MLLFLHGFFASGSCIPAQSLRKAFEGEEEVLSPDLPLHPNESLKMIRDLCVTRRPDVIVGNSAGSFLGQQVAAELGIPAVLGNPYFIMSEFLESRIGPHSYKSPRADGRQDFIIDQQLIDEFIALQLHQFDKVTPAQRERVIGLFGTHDTLAHFEPLFLQHYTHAVHFPGAHTPTADEVMKYYAPAARKLLALSK
ncbi:MAG: YqiA/YcfP family alpha/beta fold hydrolase [Prevotella sp.]|jgi:predicted esterase YcpF (UPF0227 family)